MSSSLIDSKPLRAKAGQVIFLKDKGEDTFEVIYVGEKYMKVVQSGYNRVKDAFSTSPANVASIYIDVEPKKPKQPLYTKQFSRVTQLKGFGRQWFFIVRHDEEKGTALVCTLDRKAEAWAVQADQFRNNSELSFMLPKVRSMVLHSGPDNRRLVEIEAEEAKVDSGEMTLAEVMVPITNFRGEPWTGIPTSK